MNGKKAKAIRRMIMGQENIPEVLRKRAGRLVRRAYARGKADPSVKAGIQLNQKNLSVESTIHAVSVLSAASH